MSMELLQHVTGTRMVHVPYKGAGPGMAALIAGEIDLIFVSVGAALPHIQSGRLRGVAVGAKQRLPALPQLATLHESGYRVDASSWYGVVAPSATPADALSTLERTLMQVLKDSTTNNRLTQLGFDVDGSGPETFRRLIREESELWKNVIKAAGLKRQG